MANLAHPRPSLNPPKVGILARIDYRGRELLATILPGRSDAPVLELAVLKSGSDGWRPTMAVLRLDETMVRQLRAALNRLDGAA